ncbi:MAG: hypothetical protein Q8M94_08930 [Ignavibacteria bacterium]|nr:hypothetical protein [Ignavibacteria bacterium]
MKKIKFKNSSKEITIGKIVCVGRNYAEHAREVNNFSFCRKRTQCFNLYLREFTLVWLGCYTLNFI